MNRLPYILTKLGEETLQNRKSKPECQYMENENDQLVSDKYVYKNSNKQNGAQSTKKIQKKKKKLSNFTKSEDRQIVNLVRQIGPKFNIISHYFQNKTLSMVKNRFYKVLRYQETEKITQDVSQNNIQESLENSKFCPEIKEIMNKFLQDFQFFRLSV